MAYRFDPYDEAIVIDGWEQGIGDSPYQGLSDMRNLNIISIPGEGSVNFSTTAIAPPAVYGETAITGRSGNTLTIAGLMNLLTGSAIVFTDVGSLTGVSTNTTYWAQAVNGTLNQTATTSFSLWSDYYQNTTVTLGGTAGTAKFRVLNFCGNDDNSENTGVPTNVTYSNTDNAYFMQDGYGRVWSNSRTSYDSRGGSVLNYWTCLGLTGSSDMGYPYGLVYYQSASATTRYVFRFGGKSIDYFNIVTGTWTWGWKPSTGGVNQTNYLHTLGVHTAIVAPDSKVYYCDGNWIGEFFQKDPTVDFDPTNTATYTFANQTALLPSTDNSRCIGYLGTNILIGGQNNIIYSWDGFSTGASWILLPEFNTKQIVTVNTNAFIFVGNRGRIYVTNGTNAQLYKKIPDHISGTVEPYFTWGGAMSYKNQLYFSALVTTNSGSNVNQYGGVWAIDLDSKAIRLTNKLSTTVYSGYVGAITPNFSANAAGTGFFAGWSQANTTAVRHFTIVNGSATITANASDLSATDVGAPITGTGIPNGSIILSVQSSSQATLNQPATANNNNVILTLYPRYGIDTTQSTPYTGGETTIDSDLIPIGTYQKPKDVTSIEYKLSRPLVSGESIAIYTRLIFNTTDTGYSQTLSDSTVGNFSGKANINFKNAQWAQFQIVLTSTASSPSYVRLKQIRILGVKDGQMGT